MPEPLRRKPGKGASLSPAARGVVKVGDDFAAEYPDGDASSTEAFASLARAGSAALQELDRHVVASFDMSQPAATVLAVVEGADAPLTPSQIGERVIAASATMTANLDLLERRGLIRRLPNPDDRRSTLIEITADGQLLADQLLPGIRVLERAAFDGLTQAERVLFLDLLAKVLARLADVAAKPPIPLTGVRHRPSRPQRS
ncbi:MAG TPA: MarR family transcriptional regulator [Acidothermaceae bacterium]